MRKFISSNFSFFIALAAPAACFAQTSADVPFNGTVLDSCTVVATTPGVLQPNATHTQLSSENAGGSQGGASITTTSAIYEVQVDAPTAFTTAPAGADANTTYLANYSATGATTATDVPAGTATALGSGITSMTLNSAADKSSGVYPAGAYTLTTTVRCVTS